MEVEVWRDIVGYEGLYQASNTGKIKSLWFGKERILKPSYDRKGYARVALINAEGEKERKRIASIIATTFISAKPFEKAQVDHIDRNRRNNNADNLRWVSSKENCRNTRRNHLFTINGTTKCMVEWCEVYNVPYLRVRTRVYRGWDIETALTEPSRK